ncbi:hypothetical protein [Streptomyces pinistramenti]|uniref:hypothetical protein n=1 Tax=Streptomyces pinistramenti TaxID=2884812 RepID=UPI001D06BFBD|nr:hypothetical protein [Streptomyces pinistramenti]MCB5909047.1 hypothetical protein [Streptomyces pinistramenti]
MASQQDQESLLDAVAGRLTAGKVLTDLRAPGAVRVTWRSMLECQVTRCIETRGEDDRRQHGQVDLARHATYRDLWTHPVPEPSDAKAQQEWTLVRQDSVREHHCECGNGRVPCDRCTGRGDLVCEPLRACPSCGGADSCATCGGTGKRGHRSASAPAHGERETCVKCGAEEAACHACRGAGRVRCTDCGGSGKVDCPGCGGEGSVDHTACGGAGRTTTWTEGTIKHRSVADKVPMPTKPPPVLVRLMAQGAGEWRTADCGYGDPLPDDLSDAHRDAVERGLAKRSGELKRRAGLRYLPIARVVVAGEAGRVFYAFPEAAGTKVMVLPSARRVALIAAAAVGLAAAVKAVFLLLG